MPSLGADMESGTLVQWLVKPGDAVKRGDIVAVIETQKGAIDVEIFDDGVVGELAVAEGTVVPVGAVMAYLNGGGPIEPQAPAVVPRPPKIELAAPEAVPATMPALERVPAEPLTAPPVPCGPDGRRIHISPLARRRAAELGLDLREVHGTRPEGAISAHDVEVAWHARQAVPVAAPPPVERMAPAAPVLPAAVPPDGRQSGMRAAIAAAMAKSNREIPHYYLGTDIDMKRTLDWLEAENLKRTVSERLLYAVPLIKATALALREHPDLNGFYREDGFEMSDAIHIGWAIALKSGGLVAPAIHDADLLTLDQIMQTMRDLIVRSRGGKLRSSEMMDPTITVTSLGEQGVPEVYGVIYPPQVALVGFGTIVERPWAVNGMLTVRPVLRATLAADHRASDGHRGGLFLAAIDRLLQEPEKL
jgi:pyruvate dehydrogenase E2 component (dihydrolipoamide acetyltransferase)